MLAIPSAPPPQPPHELLQPFPDLPPFCASLIRPSTAADGLLVSARLPRSMTARCTSGVQLFNFSCALGSSLLLDINRMSSTGLTPEPQPLPCIPNIPIILESRSP